MKTKKYFVYLIICLLLLFSFIFLTEAQEKPIIMKFGHVGNVESVSHLTSLEFKKAVEEKTDGKVKIDIYPSSQLGGPRDMIEGLEIGTVNFVLEPFTRLQVYEPLANLANILFMIRDRNHGEKVWNGPIGEEFFEIISSKSGIKVMANMWRGTRIITSTKPILDVNDLEGLKIRVPPNPILIEIWKKLGASPSPVEFNELFMALKTGVVKAQENPIILSYTSKFHEIAKYWIMTDHVKQFNSILMSADYFDNLSPDIQNVIKEAGLIAAKFHGDYVDNEIGKFIEKLKDEGVTIIYPGDMDNWQAKLEGFMDNYPDFKPWYEKIVAVE